ncbi:hypothetical protein H0G86_012974 [Trichoderma simmonsii]|uniref:Tat pathway signal sequence n=1 Tax=Trichoderma simmonsii TaxID=1491479 RepID=A0A8G0LSE0_9HYPO|nr:hypothetical protein H0G86_012974 [Trichoderma simmonsii]
MFTSKTPDAEYKRLTEGDDSDAGENVQSQTSKRLSLLEQSFRRSSIIHASILLLEVILCALLISGFMVLNQTRRAVGSKISLDGLSQLGSYNTSMKFQDGSKHMADSHDADNYWRDLLDSGGVISLNTEWARKQGLRPSAQSPTDPSQSIYQVDVFHALHCLNAIRQNLMSETPPPWDETHMLHCLDYVRSQLLCHPDLTLVPTNDLEEFVLDEVHTCRDYNAMADWVYRHRWVEFPEWLKTKAAKNKGHEATHNHTMAEPSGHDHS